MEHNCPRCESELPEEAVFCPRCAQSIQLRKSVRQPVPLRRKLLLGLLILAATVSAGAGLWLSSAPRTYDGYGEVVYGNCQLVLGQQSDGRFVPAPELFFQGELDEPYRVPSRLYINDVHTGEDAAEAFLAEVEMVTAEFTGQENSPSPIMVCSQPAYHPGVPECSLVSLIDFTGESGTAELVWTFRMKNRDTIYLRQTYKVDPIQVYDYAPEEYPMDTAEELQALVDRIREEVDGKAVVNLYLPPVTYGGGVTIQDRNVNLYGSTDPDGNRTTFTGPVRLLDYNGEISYLYDIDFVGGGSGMGLSGSAPFQAINCTFTGWDTAVLAYGDSWANVIGCTFRYNIIGFRFDSNGSYANHSMFNDNIFVGNNAAVRLDNVPTDVTLDFRGSVFLGNGNGVVNVDGHPIDLSQAAFA